MSFLHVVVFKFSYAKQADGEDWVNQKL